MDLTTLFNFSWSLLVLKCMLSFVWYMLLDVLHYAQYRILQPWQHSMHSNQTHSILVGQSVSYNLHIRILCTTTKDTIRNSCNMWRKWKPDLHHLLILNLYYVFIRLSPVPGPQKDGWSNTAPLMLWITIANFRLCELQNNLQRSRFIDTDKATKK